MRAASRAGTWVDLGRRDARERAPPGLIVTTRWRLVPWRYTPLRRNG